MPDEDEIDPYSLFNSSAVTPAVVSKLPSPIIFANMGNYYSNCFVVKPFFAVRSNSSIAVFEVGCSSAASGVSGRLSAANGSD